jgi:hypothetical protein
LRQKFKTLRSIVFDRLEHKPIFCAANDFVFPCGGKNICFEAIIYYVLIQWL